MRTKFKRVAFALCMPLLWASNIRAAEENPLILTDRAHTMKECLEVSEFIMHAAMSRDYGKSGAEFIDRARHELSAIRRYPDSLRWFARTEKHERFILAWAREAFYSQSTPEEIQKAALISCQGGPLIPRPLNNGLVSIDPS